MTGFTISNLQDASILALNDMKDVIQIDPVYQRVGGVWSSSKKKLFIDSLLNKYDVPKFYFHILTGPYANKDFQYSIIDGRQRLEAIWEFIAGDFPLANDFVYLEDPTLKAAGLTFNELAKEYPRLATRFNSRSLSVMVVAADDLDFIEDMFSRLNEAVPLNAAEKRNAFGGPLPQIARDLSQHRFFSDRVSMPSTRYRHHDMAAKLLYLQSNLLNSGAFVDTKKASLDAFFRSNRDKAKSDFQTLTQSVEATLSDMENTFVSKDELLRSAGVIPVYFCLFSRLQSEGKAASVSRKGLMDFEAVRSQNRQKFENEEDGVEFKLIEFDELAQSSNDAASIRSRYEVIRENLGI